MQQREYIANVHGRAYKHKLTFIQEYQTGASELQLIINIMRATGADTVIVYENGEVINKYYRDTVLPGE